MVLRAALPLIAQLLSLFRKEYSVPWTYASRPSPERTVAVLSAVMNPLLGRFWSATVTLYEVKASAPPVVSRANAWNTPMPVLEEVRPLNLEALNS